MNLLDKTTRSIDARRRAAFFVTALVTFTCAPISAASFYPARLEDPKAVYVAPSNERNDTEALQHALNRVQETTGQGIVFVAPGRYFLNDTIHVWPGIRILGWGAERPTLILTNNAAGFEDESREKVVFFFAGGRPGFGRRRSSETSSGSVPDANPGTFYSAIANLDIEIGEGNPGAVAVRARYAQHCFLAHMTFRLGSALAGIHEGGNVVEDVQFIGGTHAIWTSKPSPGWQFTIIDCSFEGQRRSAILEREAGLTLIRPVFRKVPCAVEIEPDRVDELWVKDATLEEISGPAFVFGREKSSCQEINMEGVGCRKVPVFAKMHESGKMFSALSESYEVKAFSHGLHFSDNGASPEFMSVYEAGPTHGAPARAPSDLPSLPPADTWVNIRSLGANGDGTTDDTQVIRNAIAAHRTLYFPSGFYAVRDTLLLKPDTILIGLHPGATQLILPDGTAGYRGAGERKALLETPTGGSNIVIGIGLYTSGNNRRAVAALWRSGTHSLMNDVRFLGGHGTPLPDGGRENPYNPNHTADPDPNRRWDSQYPSLWVTDGGGGTFLDIWTPSTFAQAGMRVSDTRTEGRVYQMSSEHHVRNEVQVRNAANWRFYALQTEEERGESGFALPIEVDSSTNITFANFHAYRVISCFQPFPYTARIANSRDIRFRNLHAYSNSKVSFDSAVFDQTHGREIRQREFAWLDISGKPPMRKRSGPSPVLARGASVEKLAGGFYNISGGATGAGDDFYFVDSHWQRVYRWNPAQGVTLAFDAPMEPVNVATDDSGSLLIISYSGNGVVFSAKVGRELALIEPREVTNRTGVDFYLPVSDWHLNRNSLARPSAHFAAADGTTVIPAGEEFLHGAMSWGVKSSPQIRSFGLEKTSAGKTFYVTDESDLRTWAAKVGVDGALSDFKLFVEQGGEGVTTDSQGNVYIAAGQVYVYDKSGNLIDTIEVPERPLQVVFGGSDGKTLFIPARTSLYSVRTRFAGQSTQKGPGS